MIDLDDLSIPLSDTAKEAVADEATAPGELETLDHDEALKRPRPFTYVEKFSGATLTLN